MINTQTTVQESRHRLARKIFHGQRGRLYQKHREGQEDQLGGLVVNAVVLWNTRYVDAIIGHLRAQGTIVLDEDVIRLSPLGHAHINELGRYTFPPLPARPVLRALRDPSADDSTDVATGTKADRPQWNPCLDDLRPGDTLIVWKIDRLGRNLRDLIDIVTTLRNRGVGVRSLTNGIVDTTTAHGTLVFGMFALMAEYEAALIRERTQAGLAAARAGAALAGANPTSAPTNRSARRRNAEPRQRAGDRGEPVQEHQLARH